MHKVFEFTRTSLRAGTALQALALIGAGIAGCAAVTPASAQDYTSGAIQGTVTDDSGNGVAGATIRVTSVSQGTTRTATSSSTGAFQINGLPGGSYDVVVESPNTSGWRADGIPIRASQAAQINPRLGAAGGGEIVVVGSRAVSAFTGSTTGLNVDVADFIQTKPLGRDLTSVVLLAPNTTIGDGGFGNLAAIGGSSPAENAYYLNGLNLTNFDNYLGGAAVPFYFYQSVETKVGGYPAEFGRATGGIVNAVSKAGTNEFKAEAHIDWAPQFLRSRSKDTLAYNGSAYVRNSNVAADTSDSLLVTLGAGGPLIPDHLFVYGMTQFQRTKSLQNLPLAGTAYSRRNDDPFWGVKVDAFPIDSQHFEATVFDTRNTTVRSDLPYSIVNGVNTYGTATAGTAFNGGGLNYVGKYTGRMTDWFTVSAAYGRVRDRFDNVSVAGAGNLPSFSNASGAAVYGVPNGGFYNGQRVNGTSDPYNTERRFFRADADLLFSVLGDHHVRFGYDQEINTLNRVTVRNGGAYELANGAISPAAYGAILGNGGIQYIVRASNVGGPVVELNYFNTGGTFKAKNKAYYIQDEWKLFDRLTLNLGARRDDFRVNKPSGNPIANLTKNYAPRVGATYQLLGDKSGKLYGSYGWTYLPIASNTAFRQGAPSFYFRQRYNFSGLNAAGLPNLTQLVTNQGTYQTACPFALIPNGATTNCLVTGDGADIDTTQALASNLKATRQTEINVGYEQKVGLWTLGLSYTHRNLDRTAEDSAIDAAVNAYCAANNVRATPTGGGASVPCSSIFTGFHQYVINNPGSDITVNLLANGYNINNRTVTLTADQLGYGKAKRTYDAVVFTFDRRFDGLFAVGGSYTWSKSKGNSEGYVQSDFVQADSGITQDFDQPGFVDYSYGYLPNDRRHQLKLYGNIKVDAFNIGLNTLVYSPRPQSCFGWHPTDVFADGYGAASHYCGGQPSARGTAQKTDWYSSFNLQLSFSPTIADRTVTLRADVFNLLNSRAVTKRYELGDLDVVTGANGLPTSYIPDPNYGQPTAYQAPRYVRLGVDINF
ncbi:TonB-dependent receptor [Sphingomonas sp. A2-49]|uniref:TonB-dependent receptor n=1 Tax=Sphingomonas sp. A2-49 TaxID=1391375 RepID=UPI0021CF8535|nr:carboxypeptidase regulatory-like domain-containing protein [Sphingomonas sp. A2-49]MCU6454494.1 TonB-dependent receptor [Sphingomonas sp. A2-49]